MGRNSISRTRNFPGWTQAEGLTDAEIVPVTLPASRGQDGEGKRL